MLHSSIEILRKNFNSEFCICKTLIHKEFFPALQFGILLEAA